MASIKGGVSERTHTQRCLKVKPKASWQTTKLFMSIDENAWQKPLLWILNLRIIKPRRKKNKPKDTHKSEAEEKKFFP